MPTFDDVVQAISLHGEELSNYPGVIGVRAGYLFQNDWITTQPAIVVTVLQKLPPAQLNAADTLPQMIGNVPVDVEPAPPAKQLLATHRAEPAPTVTVPGLGAAAQVGDMVFTTSADGANVNVSSAAGSGMPTIPYVPPATPLSPVTGPLSITCSTSPDSGWAALQPVLTGVRNRLTVAMYEFTAPHIRDAILNNAGIATLNLICDPGEDPLAAGDDAEPDLVCRLSQHFDKALNFDWALTSSHARVTKKIFKTSYHIKVAVADGQVVWLSSGNWKSANQPATAPANPISKSFWANHDRDWHVVVQSPQLAATFEAYILNDQRVASLYQAQAPCAALAAEPAKPDLFVPNTPAAAARPGAQAAAPVTVFRQKRFDLAATDSIQPVLTPDIDGYVNYVLPLVQGATHKLYFQNQYIKPGPGGTNIATLLAALAAKAADPAIDVRIILRDEPLEPEQDTRLMLEQLVHAGIPPDRMKLQTGVHNKGIVADSSSVLVSSQNWSSDGVQFNRDAGVIVHNADVAQYFEEVFLYDWDNYAEAKLPSESRMPLVAPPGAPAPTGMTRVNWADRYKT